jgi:hypothetical protein
MAWKNALYALLAVVLPVVFGWVAGLLPGFPMTSADFTALLLWILGLLVGGWQASAASYKLTGRLLTADAGGPYKAKMAWNEGMPFEWKNVLYALLGIVLPMAYTWLTNTLKGFPLTTETFVTVMLWLAGLAVGGWQGAKALYVSNGRLLDSTRTMRL